MTSDQPANLPTLQPSSPPISQPSDWHTILNVKNLRVHYATPLGDVIAVNGVNFKVYEGETLGLVGESGCGKTTTAMALLRLVQPPGRIVEGEVWIRDTNILALNEQELRQVRWSRVALIPQGAMNSLNPVMRIKDQIADGIETHHGKRSRAELKKRILELLNMVGLPNRVYDMYPHELSGGMKQRVCIAMAIALMPSLIIADEPTSALDVIVQRVVAQTLLDVKERLGVSMILIGHDMGLVAQLV
ncbi:MAG TPA: ABC transporter ATP-binding protein, partial [Anaerolineae bacterium]|nr:ABC transporter ATP-binding protein [Anaerolineae bacterium]